MWKRTTIRTTLQHGAAMVHYIMHDAAMWEATTGGYNSVRTRHWAPSANTSMFPKTGGGG